MSLIQGSLEPEHCTSSIPPVGQGDLHQLDESELGRLAGFVGALADPIRLQIVNLLSQRGDLSGTRRLRD